MGFVTIPLGATAEGPTQGMIPGVTHGTGPSVDAPRPDEGFAGSTFGVLTLGTPEDNFVFAPALNAPELEADFGWHLSASGALEGDVYGLSALGVEAGISAPSDEDLFTGAAGVTEEPSDYGLPGLFLSAPLNGDLESMIF